MTVLVTKANSDYWYKIEEYNTIEELYEMILKRKHPVIIREQKYYTEPEDFDFWEGMKKEDIPKIINTKLHIEIYNSYIE